VSLNAHIFSSTQLARSGIFQRFLNSFQVTASKGFQGKSKNLSFSHACPLFRQIALVLPFGQHSDRYHSSIDSIVRIVSLNLNGIRSAARKGVFEWLPASSADFVCLQELKAQAADMTPEMCNPAGYVGSFHYAEKKGYSGVGIWSRRTPDRVIEGLGIAEIDAEGRYLEAQFGSLSVVSVYLPSGSSGEHRETAKFAFMVAFYTHLERLMQSGRDIVICGDWNIAHTEKDLKNWKGNLKNSGFLPEERAWIGDVFGKLGWVDVYRRLYPETEGEGYTWWSNRGQAWAKNVGWRIDYQLAAGRVAAAATSASVYKAERFSDHAPLIVDYDISL
jgi:exodeoxyribonuclease-3